MISIFTTVTNAQYRGDNYAEALKCYSDLADEVIVVNGGGQITNHLNVKYVNRNWPREFNWPFIGEQFTRGYKACSGDWVIHCDLDYFFHERDMGKIRQALKDYPSMPAVSFYKWQFILPDRYNLKSRLLIAVNKKAFGDRLKFNGGGDLCQPTLDGKDLDINEMPQAGVPFYNYEKLSKTEAQIIDDVVKMDHAYFKHYNKWLYSSDGSTKSAYEGWLNMSLGRFHKPSRHIKLYEHPRYIQDTIRNLKPDQFGYDAFGLLERNDYVA